MKSHSPKSSWKRMVVVPPSFGLRKRVIRVVFFLAMPSTLAHDFRECNTLSNFLAGNRPDEKRTRPEGVWRHLQLSGVHRIWPLGFGPDKSSRRTNHSHNHILYIYFFFFNPTTSMMNA